ERVLAHGFVVTQADAFFAGEEHAAVEVEEVPAQEAGGGLGRVVNREQVDFAHGADAVVADLGAFVAGHVGGDERGGVEAPGDVVERLPAAGELDRAPGGDGPAVVELPVDRAHAVRHGAAVVLDAD